MTKRVFGSLLFGAFLIAAFAPLAAQTAPPPAAAPAPTARPPAPPQVPTPVEPADPADVEDLQIEAPDDGRLARRRSQVVGFGQNYTVGPADVVRDVVTITGHADVQGRVEGDLVVIMGSANLASTAHVTGSLVVISSDITVAPGAVVERDFVAIVSAVSAPAGFSSGGEHVVIDPLGLGSSLRGVVPWITRGLLWGRLIVADLQWIWAVVGITFFVYLTTLLLFTSTVRSCAEVVASRPLSAFLVGLLVLLLSGPVLLIIAASVVGIAVIPFLLCAMIVAAVIGRIGVAKWIGGRILPESEPDNRLQIVRSFVIGFVVVILLYMVPVLGIVTWATIGVLGLGAASMTLTQGWRRENPAKPRRVAPVAPSASVEPAAPPVLPVDVAPPSSSHGFATADAPAASVAAAPPFTTVPDLGRVPTTLELLAHPRADFGERLLTLLLDFVLVAMVASFLDNGPLFFSWPFGFGGEGLWLVLLIGYHVAFWTTKSTTVGGIICNLRVVKVDATPLTVTDAFVRALAGIFSVAVFGLGFFWVLRDRDRQAWHDIIAGTYVVRVPKGTRLP